ncbi:MAG: hypothetical protein HOE90_09815 [Bacteriovoracaceae bacterium]|jgi:hypothetical protein|nr:hypothetical protein [Bacteriovoracaceae bacterium]
MSKTVLLEESEKKRELFALNLNMYVGTDVIARESQKAVIELLEILPEIDLIIVRNTIGGKDAASELIQYLKAKQLEIPVIVLGGPSKNEEHAEVLSEDCEMPDVVKAAAKLLGVTAKMMAEKNSPEFFPIDLKFFYNLDSSPCDVYVRIHKGKGDYQFVKRIHQSDTLDEDSLEKYSTKGVKELYVESKFRLSFTKYFTETLVKKLDDDTLTTAERMKLGATSYDFVAEDLQNLGLTEDNIALASASIKAMSKNVAQTPKLRSMLASLMSNKASFRYKHCQLLTFITFHIVGNMEWGSKEQTEKLSFVAYFHDIILTDDVEALVHTIEDFEKFDGSKEVLDRVKKHAMLASELTKNYPSLPIGADTLIRQHHGTKNGVGFTDHPSAGISPLAVVFIVAEDFVHRLLKKGVENFDKESALHKMEERFTSSKYRKAIQALREAKI